MIWKNLSLIALVFLAACGGENGVPAETFMAESEAYAKRVDDKVGVDLAYRSVPGFLWDEKEWNAMVGYRDGKPAVVRLLGINGNMSKWWMYPDSISGKIVYLKEEVQKDGRVVKNRIAYRGDSAALALASNDPYVAANAGKDIRVDAAAINTFMKSIVDNVEQDLKELTVEANAARRENAQFFATGGRNSWILIVNPSQSTVTFNEPGKEPRKFGYDVPRTNDANESVYTFASLKGKIEFTVIVKSCSSSDDRNYPYTVVLKDENRSLNGCGVLLQ